MGVLPAGKTEGAPTSLPLMRMRVKSLIATHATSIFMEQEMEKLALSDLLTLKCGVYISLKF